MNSRIKTLPQKNARAELARWYLTALRAQLEKKSTRNGNRAQGLGRAAMAGGLAMVDLAVVHEQALLALAATHDLATPRNEALKRAGLFFRHVLIPLEARARATGVSNRHLRENIETLRVHTAALARGNKRLEREILRRKAGEEAILQGKEEHRVLLHDSQIMQRKLRQLTRQIIMAQEEERKEISRELHDEVVQTLVGINVELAALGRGASTELHTLREKIARTQRLVENSVKAVHRFARELRPAVLDDLGLIPALHAYSKNLAERKKLKIRMTAFGGVEALGHAKRTVLYRVAQEALTNVARHAQATHVQMCISESSGMVRMEISDNGKSFQVDKTLRADSPKRLGLIGMKERIEMVGGSLVIESAPNSGTMVRAEIPFNQEKAKK